MARGGILAFKREPSKPHRCEYHNEGIQCRQFAMHNEYVCYQHRDNNVPTVIENDPFLIEHLDDRATLQKALADVASRLACNRMDLKRAGLLLYNLQIAATNLDTHERNQATVAAQQLAANEPATSEPAAPDAIALP